MNPAIYGTLWNFPASLRFSGVSGKKSPSTIGLHTFTSLTGNLFASTARRHFIISRLSLEEQPSCLATFLVWFATSIEEPIANGERSTPLIEIARWKRPLDRGDNNWSPTLDPPALSPNIVTEEASPPKSFMFSCTHFRASIWSSIPEFPGAWESLVVANPSKPRRYCIVTSTTPHRGITSPGLTAGVPASYPPPWMYTMTG